MPTSPILNLPASAPSADRSKEQPAARGSDTAGGADGFGKALGHARNGAARDDAPAAAHASVTRRDGKHQHAETSPQTRKADDKSDHDTPAGAVLPFVPGLELRPVIAGGSGKNLPVTPGTDKAAASAHGAHDGVQSLLSQLEGAAAGKPSNKADALISVAHGKHPLSGADESAAALEAFAKAAVQGHDGGKKDDPGNAIQVGLSTPNLQPTSAPAQPAAAHQLQIPAAPTSPDFAQSLSQHVAWLGSQDIKQAVIHLHPRDLGSINVNVQVNNHNQVDVSFAVQHPATVHALQQTLPQLDTLLAQQGLNLGQAQVGQQHNGQQQAASGDGGAGAGQQGHAQADTDIAIEAPAPARPLAIGLVDDFA